MRVIINGCVKYDDCEVFMIFCLGKIQRAAEERKLLL